MSGAIAWAFPDWWKGRYEILLDTAKRLRDEGYNEAAVVTAHTACEVCTEITVSGALREKGLDHLSKPIDDLLPNYTIRNEKVRKLYEALTGDRISQESFWPDLITHARRRNNIVHNGEETDSAGATESIEVVEKVVRRMQPLIGNP